MAGSPTAAAGTHAAAVQAPAAAPPSALSIAGQMVGGAVTSTAGKIAGGVIAALVVALMVVGAISGGAAGVLGALFIAFFVLFGLAIVVGFPAFIVVLIIAAGRARKAEVGAMQGYAAARSLSYAPTGTLPGSTPLLRAGDRRETQDVMSGTLYGGLLGTLAHYTFSVRSTDNEGRSRYSNYPHTVVLVQVPESARLVRKLLCYGEGRMQRTSLFGLDFSGDREVELESSVVNERYDIRTSPDQDHAWLRELLTPTFIDWLATAPRGFSFELVDGLLCVSMSERFNKASDLDWLCTAAGYVTGRIRREALEESAGAPAA